MRVERGSMESQRLLVPEPVHLSASEAAAVLEQSDALRQLGLEIEPFGGDTVLVTSNLPAMPPPRCVPDRLLRDLAEHLRSSCRRRAVTCLMADLLHMVACKAAVKAGQKLSPEEVRALLDRRHLVSDSHHCPQCRPADRAGVHQVGAGAPVRSDLKACGGSTGPLVHLPSFAWERSHRKIRAGTSIVWQPGRIASIRLDSRRGAGT